MPDSLDSVIDAALAAAPADAVTEDTTDADETTDATSEDELDDDKKFDASYVRKLRAESAKYRTEAKQARDDLGRFTAAFDGWDEADREVLLQLPSALRNDPAGAARWMQGEAERILATTPQVDDPREGTSNEDRPLTKREIDEILAERDQAAAVTNQLGQLEREVTALGIDWGSEEATTLLGLAASHTNGDIAKAHDIMAGWAQKAIDEYVGGKKKDATAATIPTPAAGGNAPTPAKITNVRDAGKAAAAFLAAQGMK